MRKKSSMPSFHKGGVLLEPPLICPLCFMRLQGCCYDTGVVRVPRPLTGSQVNGASYCVK